MMGGREGDTFKCFEERKLNNTLKDTEEVKEGPAQRRARPLLGSLRAEDPPCSEKALEVRAGVPTGRGPQLGTFPEPSHPRTSGATAADAASALRSSSGAGCCQQFSFTQLTNIC